MMVLVCYDGSADAQAAIDGAGRLMPGSDATVLVVWETMLESMTRTGALGMGLGLVADYGDDEIDAAIRTAALDTATDGAQRAAAAGLVAEPRIVKRDDNIAAVILAAASDVDADVIVVGTRGRSGVKSLMLGSVSNAVAHHADRPVLVIPSPALAEERHRWVDHVQTIGGASPQDRDEKEQHERGIN
jgi:nucleotide-binding universal stress UspA family protein